MRAPGSPAPLSIFFNSGATPRRIVRRRGARCIVRAPGGPASTRGPRLGTYCADVRLGASCVPREVQRFSLSLSARGPRLGASCADVELGASCVPWEVQRQLGGHVSAHRTCPEKSSINSGPCLGASCADVELGASCVPRKVQRLSLSLSLNSGPTPRRIVRRRGARRIVRASVYLFL